MLCITACVNMTCTCCTSLLRTVRICNSCIELLPVAARSIGRCGWQLRRPQRLGCTDWSSLQEHGRRLLCAGVLLAVLLRHRLLILQVRMALMLHKATSRRRVLRQMRLRCDICRLPFRGCPMLHGRMRSRRLWATPAEAAGWCRARSGSCGRSVGDTAVGGSMLCRWKPSWCALCCALLWRQSLMAAWLRLQRRAPGVVLLHHI